MRRSEGLVNDGAEIGTSEYNSVLPSPFVVSRTSYVAELPSLSVMPQPIVPSGPARKETLPLTGIGWIRTTALTRICTLPPYRICCGLTVSQSGLVCILTTLKVYGLTACGHWNTMQSIRISFRAIAVSEIRCRNKCKVALCCFFVDIVK